VDGLSSRVCRHLFFKKSFLGTFIERDYVFPRIFRIFAGEMGRLLKIINKSLSVRLSLMIVSAMAILLIASLAVMLYYSRKQVKVEALHKAAQTLDGTVQNIDNILLSVEQCAGNFYFMLLPHVNDSNMVSTYCQRLVESNEYIEGCAIAMTPGYYKEGAHFMSYMRWEDQPAGDRKLVRKETFGNGSYTEQVWYTKTIETGRPGWLNPLIGLHAKEKPIFTFSLPIWTFSGQLIGVMGVDVSLELLSNIVEEAKPTENSYCVLLDKDASYIVYPQKTKLLERVKELKSNSKEDVSIQRVVKEMVSGRTGYMPFTADGKDFLVFYKPFERSAIAGRSMEKLGWSAAIIYPEDDIFGDYDNLLWLVLAITIAGLLFLYLLSIAVIHRQLKPLTMLTESAQKIAKGNFKEQIPVSPHNDELGRLQNNFGQMQQTLAGQIEELETLTDTLKQHGEGLRKALANAKAAERMKTVFLQNMTNQMVEPAEAISRDVKTMCDGNERTSLSANILQNGETIAELLDNLLNVANEEIRKEAFHD